jgi:hypothetical protein
VHARGSESFDVRQQKHFSIILEAAAGVYTASLYVDGKEKVVAQGTGVNHFEAMSELVLEVGVRENERMKELWD